VLDGETNGGHKTLLPRRASASRVQVTERPGR
jgi:hypothetical protein